MTDKQYEDFDREPSADLYRVLAVVVVVLGHWLLSAVTYHEGRFAFDEVLAELPYTQWLTWLFQVGPPDQMPKITKQRLAKTVEQSFLVVPAGIEPATFRV